MTIELRTFASGDTDYISKLNANVTAIKAAIDALQQQAGGAAGVNPITVGQFWGALFNNADCLIGPSSYVPTQGASTINVSPGGYYLASNQTPVSSMTVVTLNFAGQTAGTKYIVVSTSGAPVFRSTQDAGSTYSVQWTGSGFTGQPVRVCPCFYDATEATASRISTALGLLESPPGDQTYKTIDNRMEKVESIAVQASEDASNALAIAYESGGGLVRKIGCTLDGTVGSKAAIQIDFGGRILGWSIIADKVGSIAVSVSRKGSFPPPSSPVIPDPVTDKISSTTPIQITSAQSASKDQVPTAWIEDLFQWDVVQFNVDSVSTITRATLYLRIGVA